MGLKNILFLGDFPPTLGGSYFTNYELVMGLASQGLNVEVLTQPWKGDEGFDRDCNRKKGIHVRRLPPGTVSSPFRPPPAEEARLLTQFLRDFFHAKRAAGAMPDLIMLGHDRFVWFIPVMHEFGLPVVQQLVGSPTNSIAQGIFPEKETQQYLRSVAMADHVVCIAHHFKDLVLKIAPDCSAENVSVVHNEIDTTLFAPAAPDPALRTELRLPTGANVIVHASDLKVIKRAEDIIASAARVLAERDDVYYLLVGEGRRFEEVVAAVHASPANGVLC